MNYGLYTLPKGEQTMGARLPWQLHFVLWCLIFMDPQYGTCFMLPFLHPEFGADLQIFEKYVHPDLSFSMPCSNELHGFRSGEP